MDVDRTTHCYMRKPAALCKPATLDTPSNLVSCVPRPGEGLNTVEHPVRDAAPDELLAGAAGTPCLCKLLHVVWAACMADGVGQARLGALRLPVRRPV